MNGLWTVMRGGTQLVFIIFKLFFKNLDSFSGFGANLNYRLYKSASVKSTAICQPMPSLQQDK